MPLDDSGQPVGEYELAGVLIHKGSNAHHGHYVAHVKDQSTGAFSPLHYSKRPSVFTVVLLLSCRQVVAL